MVVLKLVFWLAFTFLLYNYFLYPLLLFIINKFSRENNTLITDLNFLPEVTFVVSAYNEEEVIADKIRNCLELDYPEDLLEILVVSDASTDKTDEIVKKLSAQDSRLRLLRQNERQGKSIGLNSAVEHATGEFIVFSDANAMYEKDALRQLVKYFANQQVGYVVGKALYYDGTGEPAAENEGLYWRYETFIKQLESDFHSVCVGDGAIYAIRKSLYRDLKADDIGDFANPLMIASEGYLGVFNPEAICYEHAAGDYQKEFFRKRRIVNRSWRAFKRYIKLFNIREQYKFIFELFSHKILRWFNWLLLLTLFISNLLIVLLQPSPFFMFFLLLQIGFLFLAAVGWWYRDKEAELPIFIYLPYYFLTVHFAAFLGIWDEFRGVRWTTWDHVRKT